MVFSVFEMLCNHHFSLVSKLLPQKNTLCHLSNYSPFPTFTTPQLLVTINLLSVSLDLPILDLLCKRNHMICALLYLVLSLSASPKFTHSGACVRTSFHFVSDFS